MHDDAVVYQRFGLRALSVYRFERTATDGKSRSIGLPESRGLKHRLIRQQRGCGMMKLLAALFSVEAESREGVPKVSP
jgi:hypothetical protein